MSSSVGWVPGLAMIQAQSSSPYFWSGTPTTCTSYLRVAVQKFFDLARVDVFAATDHHVLDAADDVHVALGVHGGQVAMDAEGYVNIVNRLAGLGRVAP